MNMRDTVLTLYHWIMSLFFDVAIVVWLILSFIVGMYVAPGPDGFFGSVLVAGPIGLIVGSILAIFIFGPALFFHQMLDDTIAIKRMLGDYLDTYTDLDTGLNVYDEPSSREG